MPSKRRFKEEHMIQRRHFLCAASAAAFCLTTRTGFSATPMPSALGWSSQEIQTVPRGVSKRKPVVTGLSLQPSGNLLAIVGDDHFVGLYDTRSQQFIEHLSQHTDWVRSARFSPCLLYTSPSPRDRTRSRMPSSA